MSGGNNGKGLDTECIWKMDFTAFPEDSTWGVGKESRRAPHMCTVSAERWGYISRGGRLWQEHVWGRGGHFKLSAEEKVKLRCVLDTPVRHQVGQVNVGTLRRNVWAGDIDLEVMLRK